MVRFHFISAAFHPCRPPRGRGGILDTPFPIPCRGGGASIGKQRTHRGRFSISPNAGGQGGPFAPRRRRPRRVHSGNNPRPLLSRRTEAGAFAGGHRRRERRRAAETRRSEKRLTQDRAARQTQPRFREARSCFEKRKRRAGKQRAFPAKRDVVKSGGQVFAPTKRFLRAAGGKWR